MFGLRRIVARPAVGAARLAIASRGPAITGEWKLLVYRTSGWTRGGVEGCRSMEKGYELGYRGMRSAASGSRMDRHR